MAKGRTSVPAVTRKPGEVNLDDPLYLYRIVPQWMTPEWNQASTWRSIVYNQPIAMLCRETLIANILALDWKIMARDSNQRDELKKDIEYYTRLLEDKGDYPFSEHVEWVMQDYLDLPFGAGTEIGRSGDTPDGKVLWFDLIDGATLFPTLNANEPVGQKIDGLALAVVYFKSWQINRIYDSPRREMKRKGWGMAAPQKVYLALEMMARGDRYYANMLLDTPEAGLLDLMDMSKETAEDWLKSFRQLLYGIDPFKIPVLYEHEHKAEFIPFGKPPTDLIYDRVMMQKAAVIASGYGMSLSDIGLGQSTNGGDTLAGTIRQERRTRKTGFAKAKRKLIAYFNSFLPESLMFSWVDYDDELNVALGRARLANATAFASMIDKGYISPQEARQQMIADGVMSITMPEKIPPDAQPAIPTGLGGNTSGKTPERPGLLGYPTPPSQGGHGETKSEVAVERAKSEQYLANSLQVSFDDLQAGATDVRIRKLAEAAAKSLLPEISEIVSKLSERSDIENWRGWHNQIMFGEADDEVALRAVSNTFGELDGPLDEDPWWQVDYDEAAILAALSYSFLMSLQSSSQELLDDLYLHNLIDTPYPQPNLTFRLTNESVMRELEQRAAVLVKELHEGTKYYLRRILVASVRDSLTESDIIQKIKQGASLDEILNDNTFLRQLADVVRAEIRDLTEYRIRSIVTMELGSAENMARLAQYKRVGLTEKRWEHEGSDVPCDICQFNIDLGYVPMDYQFKSAFGTCESPEAHPHGHCKLGYNKSQLYQRYMNGNFNIWTGD